MTGLFGHTVDWSQLFTTDVSLLEIFVRGTCIYVGILVLLRCFLRRQSGSVATSDILVLVLLADAAQNGMAGEYKSVTAGLFLVTTILFWSLVFDWLGFRVAWIGRLLHPPPIVLVRDGKVNIRNMRKEFITGEELKTYLRKEGVEELDDVRFALLEGDGSISVEKRKKR